MLELEESDRIDFNEFHRAVSQLTRGNSTHNSSNTSRRRSATNNTTNIVNPSHSSRNRSPRPYNKSPERAVSPQQIKYKSPFRKDLRINVLYG